MEETHYSVRKMFGRYLGTSVCIWMGINLLFGVIGIIYLTERHVYQGIELNYIYNYKILSDSLGQLKQDSLQLTQLDLSQTSIYMSLITSQSQVPQSYLNSFKNNIEPAYEFYWDNYNAGRPQATDKNKVVYYVNEPVNETEFRSYSPVYTPEEQRDINNCVGALYPMINLEFTYSDIKKEKAFTGFDDTGLYCQNPAQMIPWFVGPVDDPEYYCEDSPENPKDYNINCRNWYIKQKEKANYSHYTDVYQFADGRFGYTACVPFDTNNTFGGATCIDLSPSGSLDVFFESDAQYLLLDQQLFANLESDIKDSSLSDALLTYVFNDITMGDVDSVTYHQSTADLFNDQQVDQGELVLKNGTIWYFINQEIRVEVQNLDTKQPIEFYFSIVFLFKDDSIKQAQMNAVKNSRDVLLNIQIIFVCFSILICIFGARLMRKVARSLTRHVIRLLETLLSRSKTQKSEKENSSQKSQFTMSYTKKSCKEINFLQLNFLESQSTQQIALQAVEEGNDTQALLNYHDMNTKFIAQGSKQASGICYNNIGCIYLANGQFDLANDYFAQAINMYSEWQKELKDRKGSDISSSTAMQSKAQFILACRYFNKAYLMYLQTQHEFNELERFNRPFLNRDSMVVTDDDQERQQIEQDYMIGMKAKDAMDQLEQSFKTMRHHDKVEMKDFFIYMALLYTELDIIYQATNNDEIDRFDESDNVSAFQSQNTKQSRQAKGSFNFKHRNISSESKQEVVKMQLKELNNLQERLETQTNKGQLMKEHKGLTIFSVSQLKQYKLFLSGFGLHLQAQHAQNEAVHTQLRKQALIEYTNSLTQCGQNTNNNLRRRTLENIRCIIEKIRENDERKRLCTVNINKYLAHHYIERRSIVFIVDSTFASYAMLSSALAFVKETFNTINDTDSFGYILMDHKQKTTREMQLEDKRLNTSQKNHFLENELDSISLIDPSTIKRGQGFYLTECIKKAITWQNKVQSYSVFKNGNEYFGPYKWIICFIGNDTYNPFTNLQLFLPSHDTKHKQADINLQIIGMSAKPFDSNKSKEYNLMAQKTPEGSFVNIVDPNKSMRSKLSKDILTDMKAKLAVYKQEQQPIIHEKFDF